MLLSLSYLMQCHLASELILMRTNGFFTWQSGQLDSVLTTTIFKARIQDLPERCYMPSNGRSSISNKYYGNRRTTDEGKDTGTLYHITVSLHKEREGIWLPAVYNIAT